MYIDKLRCYRLLIPDGGYPDSVGRDLKDGRGDDVLLEEGAGGHVVGEAGGEVRSTEGNIL